MGGAEEGLPPEIRGAGTVLAAMTHILRSEEEWEKGAALIENIMREKFEEKKRRERGGRVGRSQS